MIVAVIIFVVSLLATLGVSSRLRLDPNVAALLPERGESAALRQYLRAFGGSDLSMVLVAARPAVEGVQAAGVEGGEGESSAAEPDERAAEVEAVARGLAADLGALDSVKLATAALRSSEQLDPLLVWRHADGPARARLAQALTPEGMRARLQTSRDMLLAPGAGAASEQIAADPLRLRQALFEGLDVGSGFRTQADGSFSTDDGLGRLVLVFPKGQALRGEDAKAFVAAARAVLDRYRAAHPNLTLGLTGGHAIAEATERMLITDLTWSSTLSMLLASLAFLVTFRRLRAILAVMPPLVLGTLWTAGIAAALPSGLSGIAVAFMSVVIGVGVDTGVHVYAALLEARQAGLSPAAAARVARQKTQKPVLVAAITAGAAFGSLGLSEISALRQLGILCAGGEILTALAIVAVTPEIGALLERRKPPVYRPPRWTAFAAWLTRTKRRAVVCLLVTVAPVVAVGAGFWPHISDAIVAMRPKGLEPLEVQQQIYDTFGGRPGQWVILVADPDRDKARERSDRIVERLSTLGDHIDSLDALTTIAPAAATQEQRFAERDALDLPAKAAELERALEETGFAPARFEPVLAAMRAPPRELVELDAIQKDDSSIMLSRYLGKDGADTVVVTYLLPRHEPVPADPGLASEVQARNQEHEQRLLAAVREVDSAAAVTGYGRLESSLKATLTADLPRVGLIAGALVLLALALSLRRLRDVVLAAAVVVTELGVVLFLIRVLDIPLHAYNALVLPVLLGITVDEAMFLLFRARAAAEGAGEEQGAESKGAESKGAGEDLVDTVLRREGPPVATTALTTAAGFAGLVMCEFDGLRHLGMVGALGSLTGLVVALVIVPAGLRLAPGGAPRGAAAT
ncbi:MAG: MMPL family transporter [Deltaproteobacteria bacterium]|nr:MMPL family transporter [Deltaproteobacteria bacterium]